MPNWVINDVIIKGKTENINTLVRDLSKIKDSEFSFEAILPTPEELKQIKSPYEYDLMEYMFINNLPFIYTRDIKFGMDMCISILSTYKTSDEMKKIRNNIRGLSVEDQTKYLYSIWRLGRNSNNGTQNYENCDIENGRHAYECYQKYGFTNWYDWRLANYGCKWDCSDPAIISHEDNPDGTSLLEVEFMTPWGNPNGFLSYLAYKYNVIIWDKFADEDMGVNCGIEKYCAAGRQEGYIPYGKESLQFAAEMWGEDLTPIQDPETGEWVYKECVEEND